MEGSKVSVWLASLSKESGHQQASNVFKAKDELFTGNAVWQLQVVWIGGYAVKVTVAEHVLVAVIAYSEQVADETVGSVGPEARGGQFLLVAVTRCADAVRLCRLGGSSAGCF